MEEQKDNKKKPNPNVTKKDIKFIGQVLEVHSGDSLTIQSVRTGKSDRLFLSSIRAPKAAQPYGFESKEFLRKRVVGQKVNVHMEYERKMNVQDWNTEETIQKTLIFCSVIINDVNVAVELVQKGLAEYNRARSDEEQTEHGDALSEANELALKKKLAIHKTANYNQPRWNDLTQMKNPGKAKEAFNFLKEFKRLTGVVELVLNGSRMKVRVNEQSCYILLLLDGVRCLPNDKNLTDYDTWSNKALQYTKSQLLQRDVELSITSVDKKGVFHGTLLLNKQDFAATLLQEGLAICFGSNKNDYWQLEDQAKKNSLGLWSSKILKLDAIRQDDQGSRQVKYATSTKQVAISEICSLQEFYLQDTNSKQLEKITKELENFDPDQWAELKEPVSKGTPCIALFSDDNFYRAKVEKRVREGIYLVFFIDYGNYDEIAVEDMRKIPEKYQAIEPQAQKCQLAWLTAPYDTHPLAEDAAETFKSLVWDKKIVATYQYIEGNTNYVILNVLDKKSADDSANCALLKKGYVKLDKELDFPSKLNSWVDIEDQALEKKLGVWNYDDEYDE